MPCVGAERLPITFEQLHLAVDGEHFFDESPPEMQQPHRKRSLVLGPERRAGFLKKLAQVGAQFDDSRRLTATGGARFKQDAVGDFAGTTKALLIGEAVVSAEAANGA